MTTSLQVGGITVTALNDGVSHLPPLFYPGLDFDAHPHLLGADGTHHIPAGCFLVQGDGFTVLVDAGTGPVSFPFPRNWRQPPSWHPPRSPSRWAARCPTRWRRQA